MTIPVKINLGCNSSGRVEIDGHNIADQATRVWITAVPGKPPQLGLQLVHGLDAELAARIVLATSTRNALIALGWTPPQEPPA
ncbi:MAG TPA: hypothetical protein VGX25_04125 [Actinophytocola sp.]|uniref:hypothetical protein n=1 Tax=Actinophytocola sp. TaxID=1872138 RepID=UPI002DDD708D|nr:hypothetical protein [Actinophytocola sp.]HEV2778566.1 hypothetical protein [Actinophytocola sp.]